MKKQTFEYRDDDAVLEAYVAYEEAQDQNQELNQEQKKKPAVLIFHAWAGRDEYACGRAESLAKLGYVGFAADIYGKGVLGNSKEENQKLMMPFMEDRKRLQKRILSALQAVRKLPYVDAERIAAVGYCFGGLCALDLARSGADVRGVVSFHGLLGRPKGLGGGSISASVLALHGHDDPMGTPDQVLAFENEMTEVKADWQLHTYGNAMHAFTNPVANDPSFGTVHNKNADRRSWRAMKDFLEEVMS